MDFDIKFNYPRNVQKERQADIFLIWSLTTNHDYDTARSVVGH